MTPETWTAVDRYITDRLLPPDTALDGAVQASTDAGLPAIAVSPAQGKFLHLLAKLIHARPMLGVRRALIELQADFGFGIGRRREVAFAHGLPGV